jgi:hypothetical protein
MNSDNTPSSSSQLAANELTSLPTIDSIGAIEGLDEIVIAIHSIADRDREDAIALLKLLRTLEQLHREIQQGYFQSALPNSRQALYSLLRDIEENGGWPYIQRWKLQALFANLPEADKEGS